MMHQSNSKIKVWCAHSTVPLLKQNLTGEESGGEDDVPNPAMTMNLGIEAT